MFVRSGFLVLIVFLLQKKIGVRRPSGVDLRDFQKHVARKFASTIEKQDFSKTNRLLTPRRN